MGTNITINLDTEASVTNFSELMATLTTEDKKAVVLNFMRQWVEEPIGAEREGYSEELIEKLSKKTGFNGKPEYSDRESIICSYDYLQYMKKFKSTRQTIIGEIVSDMHRMARDRVNEVVGKDAMVLKMITAMIKEITGSCYSMIQEAMVERFFSELTFSTKTTEELGFIREQTDSLYKITQRILDKLGLSDEGY